MKRIFLFFLAGVLPLTAVAQTPPEGAAARFEIRFGAGVRSEPFSGRACIVLTSAASPEPRFQMNDWFNGPQILGVDVAGLKAGEAVLLGAEAVGYPRSPGDLPAGDYFAQVVFRCNPDAASAGAPGDLFSEVVPAHLDPAHPAVIRLTANQVIPSEPFVETDRVKLVEVDSPLLTAFEGRPMKVRAGIVLPLNWRDDDWRRYRTLYFIHGFGGDHTSAGAIAQMLGDAAADILIVVPDPTCGRGHSVFADSANNGPRGQALIEELIPEVERRFHGARSGDRRYVTGISSGGWGSLWLQVTYPEQFAGVWSHCPDPVDFRDFQRIDLYTPGANMYVDEAGNRRPLARMHGGQVLSWYDDFVRREMVFGRGGQISSFEAVFGARGTDREPTPLFDRTTGAVDAAVARGWEAYDIRLILERNWATLGPLLAGKIHVYAGGEDTFFLEGAARKLGESLRASGSDAVVTVVEGQPHTILREGLQDMFATIQAGVDADRPPEKVSPVGGSFVAPPPDAVVLLDGTSLSAWRSSTGGDAAWTLVPASDADSACVEIKPGSGAMITRESFGDAQIHVEFKTPIEDGEGQNRGNSGVYIQDRYEVQVLDSFESETYPDGQCGAIYGRHVPLVNASLPQGEWQSYDILFRAPRYDAKSGEKSSDAVLTVLHNGILIHDHASVPSPTGSAGDAQESRRGPISLQDHGHLVRYRNVWIRELTE